MLLFSSALLVALVLPPGEGGFSATVPRLGRELMARSAKSIQWAKIKPKILMLGGNHYIMVNHTS